MRRRSHWKGVNLNHIIIDLFPKGGLVQRFQLEINNKGPINKQQDTAIEGEREPSWQGYCDTFRDKKSKKKLKEFIGTLETFRS